ncbi:ANTAR domain-containing protein [Kutzneria sp. CA-103260]|uniref:ANTAR domain-containing protein n=1 Tax=Kutzneria sp. CA-103260 TaxID=2802641 RepID=UPI001BA660C7|nr:ANTAR domain-containing protein [Kutzneria sp. CA-103260]
MDEVRFGPELLDRLLAHLVARLPGCDGAGVSTVSRSLRAVGTAVERDAEQWQRGEGPVVAAATGDETLVQTLPDGVTWVTAVPGSWTEDGPSVLSVYTDHEPKEDDLRLIDQTEPLLATATAVIEFCADEVLRADQMVEMVQNRRLIEQAKGLVMGATRCDAGAAFRTLVRSSQHFNVKLRDLSAALVEVVGGAPVADQEPGAGPPGAPPEPAARAARMTWQALR